MYDWLLRFTQSISVEMSLQQYGMKQSFINHAYKVMDFVYYLCIFPSMA